MSPETRAFLDDVRDAEDPTPDDERRVAAALGATLAGGTALGAGVGLSKSLKLLGMGSVSWSVIGGVALAVGVGAWLVGAKPAARYAGPASAPVTSASVAALVVPSVAVVAPSTEGVSTSASAVTEARAASARAVVRDQTRERAAPSRTESLRDEITHLEGVRAALERGDGRAALRQLDEHVTTDRQLLAERRAARILALCLAGRVEEARRAATEFVRDEPNSVQRAAVERSCAGAKTTDER